MLTRFHQRVSPREERGSVLMAALAVAIIGAMLAVLVVANAIVTARSTGVDRARTSEVHGAEGVVDAAFQELESRTPCAWPSTGTTTVGAAPSAVTGAAKIAYFDATGKALTCANGTLTGGAPASAVITATATSGGTSRTVQSKVLLTPNTIQGRGAAIYAANSILTTNAFTVGTTLPDTGVDVWVNGGNVDCNSGVTIDGNLIIADGGAQFSGQCHVNGNVWSKKEFRVNSAPTGGIKVVGGSLYATANVTLGDGSKIGKDVLATGTISGWGTYTAGGAMRAGVSPLALPQYVPKPMPEVFYRPSDWVGFANSGNRYDAYKAWVLQNAVDNGAETWAPSRTASTDKCTVQGASYDLKGPLVSPSVPTVFDTFSCSQTQFTNGVTLKLRSDLVIFAKSFYSTGNFRVTSADGQPHKLWIIVPDQVANGIAQCTGGIGDIKGDSGSLAVAPITIFMYTPCTIDTNNDTNLSGQLYGGTVNLRNALTVNYVPIGIPGVDLPSTEPATAAGYRVDIVYKREIGTP